MAAKTTTSTVDAKLQSAAKAKAEANKAAGKAAAKKAGTTTTEKKPAAKPEAKPQPAEKKEKALTSNQLRILAALAKAGEPLTYNGVREATGLKKGLTKAMAKVSSKGATYPGSMEGRGLIASTEDVAEDADGYWAFSITAAGKKALADAKK